MHPTFSLSRLSDVFHPLCCQRQKYSTLSLNINYFSDPGKVKRQHLCWTALKFHILTPSLKGVAKLGRASATASSFYQLLLLKEETRKLFSQIFDLHILFACAMRV